MVAPSPPAHFDPVEAAQARAHIHAGAHAPAHPHAPANAPAHASVFWITGLPGAGKTTLAARLSARLRARTGAVVTLLDGDRLRIIFGARYGYGGADRRALAMSYGRLCAELSSQGATVVCATVSMFEEVRDWNRNAMPRYREIYLRAPIEVLQRRHPKGLYAAARDGRMRNVPGMDLAIEEPTRADIVIDDDGEKTEAEIAELVFAGLRLLGEEV